MELLGCFYALGYHFEPQAVRERNDGLHDGRIVGSRHEVLDEAAVDLEIVDGEAAQITHARVTGAEIVDGHEHTHRAEFAQDVRGLLWIGHHRALGELQLEAARIETGLVDSLANDAEQIALSELRGRDVHCNTHARQARSLPGLALPAYLAQHPFADGADE